MPCTDRSSAATSAMRAGLLHIDVGDLVIGDGERLAGAGVERVGAELIADREQPGLAQHAIDVHRTRYRHEPVFRQHDDAPAALAAMRDQPAADRVDRAHVLADARIVGAEALQVVIEVRQVDRAAASANTTCRPTSTRRRSTGSSAMSACGPQKLKNGKAPMLGDDAIAHLRRLAVDVDDLQAVGGIDRARRHRPFRAAVHVVPPEHLRGGARRIAAPRRLPDLLAGDELVGLPPEHHLREVAEVPAVADDAVVARQQPGEERGLGRTRHRRRDRAHRRRRCRRRRARSDAACRARAASCVRPTTLMTAVGDASCHRDRG